MIIKSPNVCLLCISGEAEDRRLRVRGRDAHPRKEEWASGADRRQAAWGVGRPEEAAGWDAGFRRENPDVDPNRAWGQVSGRDEDRGLVQGVAAWAEGDRPRTMARAQQAQSLCCRCRVAPALGWEGFQGPEAAHCRFAY